MSYTPLSDCYFDLDGKYLFVQTLVPDPAFGGYKATDHFVKLDINALIENGISILGLCRDGLLGKMTKSEIIEGAGRWNLVKDLPAVGVSKADMYRLQILPLRKGKRGRYAEIEDAQFCEANASTAEFCAAINAALALVGAKLPGIAN